MQFGLSSRWLGITPRPRAISPSAHVGLKKTAFFPSPPRSARRTVCELAGQQKPPEFITLGLSALAPAIDLATGSCFAPFSRTSKRAFQFHSARVTCDFHCGLLIKECLPRYLTKKKKCLRAFEGTMTEMAALHPRLPKTKFLG